MAELNTLARPYARAVFDQAKSSSELDSWSKSLAMMVTIVEQDKVQQLIDAPSLTAKQKSDAFNGLLDDKTSKQQNNFVHLLAENRRLNLLPSIAELYELYKANHEKSVEVELESAFDVSPELSEKLSKALTKALARNVSLHTTVDKSLIGGAVIRAGDTVIDHSVRGRLDKLGEVLY